jgi:hypothetical protein
MPDDQPALVASYIFAGKVLHKAELLHVADARRVSQEATGGIGIDTSVCRDAASRRFARGNQ